ncbi:MAG: hypothetical protein CVV14_05020 [Gammaproteobacteria bacterium HGW-Gammaproteobacteria-4]|nr:MAG: hypothetical protein CVV14_05020 [Gammaproteobacteria bacterium HGW-Gammaproteobacteria-4]
MSCCGTKRASLRRFAAAPNNQGYALAASAAAARIATATNEPRLRYRGGDAIVLRGSRSGRIYAFDAGGTLSVHADDVAMLLRTGRFVLR